MAESRAKRMQVVLMLADRKEKEAGEQLAQYQKQIDAEVESLRQLDEYADQYMRTYTEKRVSVRPHELIAYSGFIQRLGEARKEQQARIERMRTGLKKFQQEWRVAYQKRESIKDLIKRLEHEESILLDKRLQKELDELVGQQYSRRNDDN
ncbi:MAG: flagellar export protein FliJ [Moraxellaceae bacterium]|nr:MAG: flagellar export protein FliJ [Moraxellaceae bacterium]